MKRWSEMQAWNEECGVMGVVGVPKAAEIVLWIEVIGTPSAPATCAVPVSQVMTRSSWVMIAAVSMNAPSDASSSSPKSTIDHRGPNSSI